MTGAQPNTGWLQACVVLDDHGFLKTGPDLGKEQLADARWERQAYCVGGRRGINLRSVRASGAARLRRRGEPVRDRRSLERARGMIQEPKSEQTLDARLDEALEMTFPASDPIAVHSSDPLPTRPPQPHEETHCDLERGRESRHIRVRTAPEKNGAILPM